MLSKPVIGPITSRYGWRTLYDSNGKPYQNFHNGLDYGWLNSDGGTKSRDIYAPASGVVSVGWNDLIGNFVSIAIDPNHVVRLCHFASVSVKNGWTVKGGQFLGRMGDTGSQAAGSHLHMDMYVKAIRVDPEPYVTVPFFSLSGDREVIPIEPEKSQPRKEDQMPRLYHQVNTTGGQAYLLENTFGIEIVSADHARAIAKSQGLDFATIPQINEFDYSALDQAKARDMARLKSLVTQAVPASSGGASPTATENAAAVELALADNFARLPGEVNNDLKNRL